MQVVIDEIFEKDNFRNSITWVRSTNSKGSPHESTKYSQFTDTILFYAKSDETQIDLDATRKPLSEEELLKKYDRIDEKGRFTDGPIERSPAMVLGPPLCMNIKGTLLARMGGEWNPIFSKK